VDWTASFFYAPDQQRAWEYVYPDQQRRWVYGASLAYRKTFWTGHPFANIAVGEDTKFVWADANAKISVLKDPDCLVALIHSGNCSPKRTSDLRYQPRPVKEIERVLGDDFCFYTDSQCRSDPSNRSLLDAKPKPHALVSAALGVGDILRITPLIRVVHQLGYEVDVFLATDYADVVSLLEGAPEIRTVFHLASLRRERGSTPDPRFRARIQPDGLGNQTYDIATFTTWSASLRDRVKARNVHLFEQTRWIAEGDSKCVERIARALGWQGELPARFAIASDRKFDLPPGTIAIHPGCKEGWPWKKWHGFDELARLFSKVVIVGTEEDLRTDNTYFGHAFSWPENAQDVIDLLKGAPEIRKIFRLPSPRRGAALGQIDGLSARPTTSPRKVSQPQIRRYGGSERRLRSAAFVTGANRHIQPAFPKSSETCDRLRMTFLSDLVYGD
jgi:hypothetical protein